MAAVRAGACGISRSSARITLFSTRASWSRGETRRRTGKGYGVAASTPEAAHNVWSQRRRMLELKMKLCDCSVALSITGLIVAMLDVELNANSAYAKRFHAVSLGLRILCIFLTGLLEISLVMYHYTDTQVSENLVNRTSQIYLIETGTQHWRIALTQDRVTKILIELLICSVCPIPESGIVNWPLLGADPIQTRTLIELPVNVLICLPMFLRIYLVCRYIVLHSRHYQDCATRTIASLNHIAVDFRFVVRSQMYERPLYMMGIATLCFWILISWMITQCERFTYPEIAGYQHLADYLWFEIITFFSIGYGDIQVKTYCGRGLAILTAIVGTLFSSTLIALVGRKMALSSSEKRVNHLIAENQMSRDHKHAAARVLQNTWRVVLRRRELEENNKSLRLAAAQRNLLRAVLAFRKTRWRLRMQMEDEDDYFTARRAFMDTEERLGKVRNRQQQINGRLTQLFEHVQLLTEMVHGDVDNGCSRTSSISNHLTVPNL